MVDTRGGGRRFALLFLAAAFVVLFAGHWLSPVNRAAMTVAAPFESVLTGITNTLGDGVSGIFDGPRLREQNLMYRRQITALLANNTRLHDLQVENAHLSALWHLHQNRPDLHLLPSKVVGSCVDSNLDPCIFIDRGTRDGLRSHMTVVDPQGAYVGYISELTGSAARVTLLLNPSSSVGVRDVRSRATGLVEGTYGGPPKLNYVLTTQSLKRGDFLETSGQYELFPPGIIVGQVESVSRRDVDIEQTATIQPVADFSSLERVAVVTSFQPTGLGTLLTKP